MKRISITSIIRSIATSSHRWLCTSRLLLCCIAVMLLCLTSCRTTKREVIDSTDTHLIDSLQHSLTIKQTSIDSLIHNILMRDSIEHSHTERDSMYRDTQWSDTLIVTDSTYIKEFADGSTLKEYWHNEIRTQTLHDIIYRDRVVVDSVYDYSHFMSDYTRISAINDSLVDSITHLRDSISSTSHQQTVTKSTPEIVKALAYFGGFALTVFMGFIVYLFIRYKKNW